MLLSYTNISPLPLRFWLCLAFQRLEKVQHLVLPALNSRTKSLPTRNKASVFLFVVFISSPNKLITSAHIRSTGTIFFLLPNDVPVPNTTSKFRFKPVAPSFRCHYNYKDYALCTFKVFGHCKFTAHHSQVFLRCPVQRQCLKQYDAVETYSLQTVANFEHPECLEFMGSTRPAPTVFSCNAPLCSSTRIQTQHSSPNNYRVTQKNGNFWKTQQKLKKFKKKNLLTEIGPLQLAL